MTTTQLATAGVFDGISFGNTGRASSSPTIKNTKSSSGGGFWGGTNFMGLLQTIGGTWAQIESAKSGKQVIVKDANGRTRDIAPQLLSKLEQQAQANKTSVNSLMKMMQMQMQQAQQAKKEVKKPKDNTSLYVGLGVGAIVLLGGIIYVTQNKKKK